MRDHHPAPVSPKVIVSSGLCIGCGSCAAQVADARIDWDEEGQLKPVGRRDWYAAPGEAFSRTCPFSPAGDNEDEIARRRFPLATRSSPWTGLFERAYVGHAADGGFRERGSSGGMVSWIAGELLDRRMVDGIAHVAPADPERDGRFFRYRISRDREALNGGAKSRYYPVEMSEVLREMREVPGRYAVVGIPCFIKAVHLACEEDAVLRERVAFTLGLFCGHMKSRNLVESFAWQMGADFDALRSVEFRLKNPDRPANWYTARLDSRDGTTRTRDWWNLVDGDWGSGFFQNRACNFCDDVTAETADISFGDAWVEPYSSDGRGTNVVVVRSPLLLDLVERAIGQERLALEPVDAEFVRETQAAGFRQRREGLAYRLSWHRRGIMPRKRVGSGGGGLPLRRKLIYRMRYLISRGSSLMFRVSRRFGTPGLFVASGRAMLSLYHGLTYSRGRAGRFFDTVERLMDRGKSVETAAPRQPDPETK